MNSVPLFDVGGEGTWKKGEDRRGTLFRKCGPEKCPELFDFNGRARGGGAESANPLLVVREPNKRLLKAARANELFTDDTYPKMAHDYKKLDSIQAPVLACTCSPFPESGHLRRFFRPETANLSYPMFTTPDCGPRKLD